MIPTRSSQIVIDPAQRREAVVEVIRSAERSLILSIFRCDDVRIIDEFASAAGRGVRVRVLITRHAKGWDKRLKGVVTLLSSAGAEVCRYQGPFDKYHAKYLVADGRTALVGSFNFTVKCFTDTCDFLFETQDPATVEGLTVLFESDCYSPDQALPELTTRLIVGPQQTRRRLTELLDAARESISIIDDRVVDPQMKGLLESKMKSGVAVRILGRGDLAGMVSHGRMILFDNRRAVIGSARLSTVSLDSRRELTAVVDEPDCVEELRLFFEYHAVSSKQPVFVDAPAAGDENETDDEL